MRFTPPTTKQLVVLSLLVVLIGHAGFVGTAAAEPRIFVYGGDLDKSEALVGETIIVETDVKNTGDSGGVTELEVGRNGSTVTTERVQMERNSDRTVEIPISISKEGRFKITADGKKMGYISISRIRTTSVTTRDDGRTVSLRAGASEPGTPLTADFPAAANQSLVVEQTTMNASGSAFNRSVATYAPAESAPFTVPTGDGSNVFGALDTGVISGVNTTGFRITVDRATIRNSGLDADEIVAYRRNGGTYGPLSTQQVSMTSESVTYEVSTDGGDEFVFGSLASSFKVRSPEITTASVSDAKQIELTARIENVGAVAGNYTARMRVNGRTVDERTPSISPGETTTVSLQHTVSESGDYGVSLGNRSVGSVVLTESDVSDQGTDDSVAPGGDSVASWLPTLPGIGPIGALELLLGAVLVIVGGGVLVLARR